MSIDIEHIENVPLKGVLAKNEMGYKLTAKIKRF